MLKQYIIIQFVSVGTYIILSVLGTIQNKNKMLYVPIAGSTYDLWN